MLCKSQNGMLHEPSRRGTCSRTCRSSYQAQTTALLNGVILRDDDPVAAARTSEGKPAFILPATAPRCLVNGCFSQRHKSKRQKSTLLAVRDASVAGVVSGAAVPGGISVKGTADLTSVASLSNSERASAELTPSASARKRWRWKKKKSSPPSTLPQVKEDWENEIKDVPLSSITWDTRSFGDEFYDPEDILPLALRGMTLNQADAVYLPLAANSCLVMRHPLPIQWPTYRVHAVQDQFADAM